MVLPMFPSEKDIFSVTAILRVYIALITGQLMNVEHMLE
jgi:hypothetical protein